MEGGGWRLEFGGWRLAPSGPGSGRPLSDSSRAGSHPEQLEVGGWRLEALSGHSCGHAHADPSMATQAPVLQSCDPMHRHGDTGMCHCAPCLQHVQHAPRFFLPRNPFRTGMKQGFWPAAGRNEMGICRNRAFRVKWSKIGANRRRSLDKQRQLARIGPCGAISERT